MDPIGETPQYSAAELQLAREGRLRLRTRDMVGVLVEIAPRTGATTDAGSAALEYVREERTGTTDVHA